MNEIDKGILKLIFKNNNMSLFFCNEEFCAAKVQYFLNYEKKMTRKNLFNIKATNLIDYNLKTDYNFLSLLFYKGLFTIDNSNLLLPKLKIPNYSVKTMFWEYFEKI